MKVNKIMCKRYVVKEKLIINLIETLEVNKSLRKGPRRYKVN
jgi:hypothetical protein